MGPWRSDPTRTSAWTMSGCSQRGWWAPRTEDLAELVPPGTSAVLVALELTYARELAQNLAAGGGFVLKSERIPAPVVNAVLDVLESKGV